MESRGHYLFLGLILALLAMVLCYTSNAQDDLTELDDLGEVDQFFAEKSEPRATQPARVVPQKPKPAEKKLPFCDKMQSSFMPISVCVPRHNSACFCRGNS
jgi:hypothetical protein